MFKKLLKFLFRLILLAAIIGIPCWWMIQRSYHDPEAHYYSTEETMGDEALRFVVLSDLNGYVFDGGGSQIVETVASVSPDAILMNGNMVKGSAGSVSSLIGMVERLSQIAPVYYAYGDQEYLYVSDGAYNRSTRARTETEKEQEFDRQLSEAGAAVLKNSYEDVRLYGIRVRIGGTDGAPNDVIMGNGNVNPVQERFYGFLKDFEDTKSYKILLDNNVEHVLGDTDGTLSGTNLVVCGHLIGGRVVIPHFGGVFGGSQGYFPPYTRGIKEVDGCKILLTTGLSVPDDGDLPRFNNPPEIAILDVSGLKR